MIFRREKRVPVNKDFFLTLIAGSEAGIATTAAIIAGLVTGTDNRQLVTISAMVALLVQAFNSSMTLITTVHAQNEIENTREKESLGAPAARAGLQFLTHIGNSLIVLLPIIFVTDLKHALLWSIGLAIGLMFLIGYMVGRTVQGSPFRDAVWSSLIGMLVISGGFLTGLVLH